MTGTAATGAALANASVEVRCAAGSGTTSTAADGSYTLNLTEGALPCRIEVKGVVNGGNVVLHSIADAGTTNSAERRTVARANVTPITEMVVAQVAGATPDIAFQNASPAITSEQVQAAVSLIVGALKTAGLDLGTTDPLKAELVAATVSRTGNAYDQLLDALGRNVSRDMLPQVVNQVANAANVRTLDGLDEAMQAVSRGSLAGCPVALSGTYRSVDLAGTMLKHAIDFKAMRLSTPGTTDTMTLTADPSDACVFTAAGKFNGADSKLKVVFGSAGAASFHLKAASTDTIGQLFPVQRYLVANLVGTWNALETDVSQRSHRAGLLTLTGDRKAISCTYDADYQCIEDADKPTVTERGDGGLVIQVSATEAVALYAYRTPTGVVTLYGGHVPTGSFAVTAKSVLAARLQSLALPAVGTAVPSWDAGVTITPEGTMTVTDPAPIAYDITSVDPATGTFTRRNTVVGRNETLHINKPFLGVRTRDAGTFNGGNFAQLVQIPLPGLGMTLSLNGVPYGTGSAFQHNIAVVKP